MAVITNQLRHPEQLPRMAEALNVDLVQAATDRKLDVIRRHDIAFKCSMCPEKNACDAWLDAHRDGAAKAPEYCLNKALLEDLRH